MGDIELTSKTVLLEGSRNPTDSEGQNKVSKSGTAQTFHLVQFFAVPCITITNSRCQTCGCFDTMTARNHVHMF